METTAPESVVKMQIGVTSGYAEVADGVRLYYEIRRPESATAAAPREKLIIIQGALATLRHLDEIAEIFVEHFSKNHQRQFEVLTFDNRGMGKSTAPFGRQTTRILASDTLSLINQVWGESAEVHVIGASLGGMISQELAVLLVRAKRLRSLFLLATQRGRYIRPLALISPSVWARLMQRTMGGEPEKIVREVLIKSCFSDDTPSEEVEKYVKRWTENFDELFGMRNVAACAAQITALNSHFLNDEGVRTIVDSKIPVGVQISAKDKVIAPGQQRLLADLLKAKKVELEQGHMTNDKDRDTLTNAMISHLESATQH